MHSVGPTREWLENENQLTDHAPDATLSRNEIMEETLKIGLLDLLYQLLFKRAQLMGIASLFMSKLFGQLVLSEILWWDFDCASKVFFKKCRNHHNFQITKEFYA